MKSNLVVIGACILFFSQFSSADSKILSLIKGQVQANSAAIFISNAGLQSPLSLVEVKFDDDPDNPMKICLVDLKLLNNEDLNHLGFKRQIDKESRYFALLVGFPFMNSSDEPGRKNCSGLTLRGLVSS